MHKRLDLSFLSTLQDHSSASLSPKSMRSSCSVGFPPESSLPPLSPISPDRAALQNPQIAAAVTPLCSIDPSRLAANIKDSQDYSVEDTNSILKQDYEDP